MADTFGAGERTKQSFSAVQDITKQLITLATGFLAVSITFLKDLIKDTSAPSDLHWIQGAWLFYFLTAVAGCLVLMAVAGQLGQDGDTLTPHSIYNAGPRVLSIAQVVTFVVALGLTVVFGWFAFSGHDLEVSRCRAAASATTSTTTPTTSPNCE